MKSFSLGQWPSSSSGKQKGDLFRFKARDGSGSFGRFSFYMQSRTWFGWFSWNQKKLEAVDRECGDLFLGCMKREAGHSLLPFLFVPRRDVVWSKGRAFTIILS